MKDIEDRWKYEKVDISLIDEADQNANQMSEDDFNSLCDNIGVSGLSSVPCCYKKDNGRYVMISGHHRLRACKKLGYKFLGILYALESELSKDEIIAIQLSHNSLHGEDDKGILKRMFAEIESIDFKKFAHIDIDEVGSIPSNGLNISPMKECYSISVILYNDSVEAFDELIGDIRELSKKSDTIILADQKDNEDLYMKVKKEVCQTMNIKSSSVAFAAILKLAYEQLKLRKNDLDSDN